LSSWRFTSFPTVYYKSTTSKSKRYNKHVADMEEITALFNTRDEAVSKKDRKLFLSTQVEEISDASSAGYLTQDKLSTVVLATANTGKLTQVAFVKETYFAGGEKSHDCFLIYFLVNTLEGWKIYRVVG
jgi:hypothetical protein